MEWTNKKSNMNSSVHREQRKRNSGLSPVKRQIKEKGDRHVKTKHLRQ